MTRMARDDAGSGAPVLLVHGFPTSRKLWAGVSARLVQAGLRAIAPDLMGYGDSPDAPDVGMESQAAWLLELLDELRLDQVYLVAHDVGTAAAQLLAIRAPGRVRKLVLMDGVHETEWAMGPVESIRSWDDGKAARLQPVLARRLPAIRDLLAAYAGESGGRRLIHAARCLDPVQTAGPRRAFGQRGFQCGSSGATPTTSCRRTAWQSRWRESWERSCDSCAAGTSCPTRTRTPSRASFSPTPDRWAVVRSA